MAGLDELLAAFESCQVVDLEQPRYAGAPIFPAHWPGFVYTLHRRHEQLDEPARTSASGTLIMQEHSGTHIDALCHQAFGMRMYGDVEVTPEVQTANGFTHLGAETIPPVVKRGVLLDVAAAHDVPRLDPGYLVTAEDLASVSTVDDVRPGDCLLVRTGNGRCFDDPGEYLRGPGVTAEAARWLAARRPFLCGIDTVAFDHPDNIDPELGALPAHTVLIVRAGIYIVENLDLERLAALGCRTFLFVCLPMKMRGVTGSPVRPVAVFPRT